MCQGSILASHLPSQSNFYVYFSTQHISYLQRLLFFIFIFYFFCPQHRYIWQWLKLCNSIFAFLIRCASHFPLCYLLQFCKESDKLDRLLYRAVSGHGKPRAHLLQHATSGHDGDPLGKLSLPPTLMPVRVKASDQKRENRESKSLREAGIRKTQRKSECRNTLGYHSMTGCSLVNEAALYLSTEMPQKSSWFDVRDKSLNLNGSNNRIYSDGVKEREMLCCIH